MSVLDIVNLAVDKIIASSVPEVLFEGNIVRTSINEGYRATPTETNYFTYVLFDGNVRERTITGEVVVSSDEKVWLLKPETVPTNVDTIFVNSKNYSIVRIEEQSAGQNLMFKLAVREE